MPERLPGMPHQIVIFGNGESRRGIDVGRICSRPDVVTVGCNAFYRDATPKFLVAIDPPMIAEIKRASPDCSVVTPRRGIAPFHKRRLWIDDTIDVCNDPHWNAGPTAAWFIANYLGGSSASVHMVGMDMGGKNLYNGTKNYRAITDPTPNYGPDANHFLCAFQRSLTLQWVWYTFPDVEPPGKWLTVPNVSVRHSPLTL